MLSYAATRNSSVCKGETFELELYGDRCAVSASVAALRAFPVSKLNQPKPMRSIGSSFALPMALASPSARL